MNFTITDHHQTGGCELALYNYLTIIMHQSLLSLPFLNSYPS